MPDKLKLLVNRGAVVDSKEAGRKLLEPYLPEEFDLKDDGDLERLRYVLTHHNHTVNAYNEGTRRKGSWNVGVVGIMLDFDNDDAEPDKVVTLEKACERFAEWTYVAYTTAGDTPQHPKFRIILPFDTLYFADPDEAVAFYEWCRGEFPEPPHDHKCFEPMRHYFPCCEPGRGRFEWKVNASGKYLPAPNIEAAPPKTESSPDKADKPWHVTDEMVASVEILLEMVVGTGNRNDQIYRRACECRKVGWSRDVAFKRLVKWNEKFCDPPYPVLVGDGKDDTSIEYMVDRAYEPTTLPHDYGPHNWPDLARARELAPERVRQQYVNDLKGEYPSPLPDVDPNTHRKKTTREQVIESIEPAHRVSQFCTYTLGKLSKMKELLDPPELVYNLLCYKEQHTILAGAAGGGKSTLLRSLAIEAAYRRIKTLWITNESEKKALWWWLKMKGIIPELEGFIEVFDTRFINTNIPFGEKRWTALEELIKVTAPEAIVNDSLITMLTWLDGGVPEHSDTDKWMEKVKRLGGLGTNIGAGVVTTHHLKKDAKRYTGSAGIQNASDDMYEMRYGRTVYQRKLNCIKTRTESRTITVVCDVHDGYKYTVASTQSSRLSKSQLKLLELLYEEGPLTTVEISRFDDGVPKTTASRILIKWEEDGYAKKDGAKWTIEKSTIDELMEHGTATKIGNVKDTIDQ